MDTERTLPSDVYLEITTESGEQSTFPITRKTVTIGRDPVCDLRIDDPFVSRKHCQIVFRGDHFTVIDLGSTNKTVVKGKEYLQKNLKHDNIIELGNTRLRFVWENMRQWQREHEVPVEPDDSLSGESSESDPGDVEGENRPLSNDDSLPDRDPDEPGSGPWD